MQEYLTDLEVVKIEAFCADEVMFNAVKQVLLAGLYTHGVPKKGKKHNPLINGAFSLVSLAGENPIPDAELGAHLRGTWFGINALENGYKALTKIKSKKEAIETPFNEAI
jgi:hypothetical protein